jgi:hypothetical protein
MSKFRHVIDLKFPDDESPNVIVNKFIEEGYTSGYEPTWKIEGGE